MEFFDVLNRCRSGYISLNWFSVNGRNVFADNDRTF